MFNIERMTPKVIGETERNIEKLSTRAKEAAALSKLPQLSEKSIKIASESAKANFIAKSNLLKQLK